LLVKTLERPAALRRLLESIQAHDLPWPVLVGDDSQDHAAARDVCREFPAVRLLEMDHDIGLSAGRNALVDAAETPFVVVLDDDFILFPTTNLDHLVAYPRSGVCDIAGGTVYHNGQITHYEGTLRLDPPRLYMAAVKATTPTRVDITYNFLAADRLALQQVRWNDELKLCEHQDFFLRAQRAGLKVWYIPDVAINHVPTNEGNYGYYRRTRGTELYETFKRTWGIEAIVGTVARAA